MNSTEVFLNGLRIIVLLFALLYFLSIRRKLPRSDDGIFLIQLGFTLLCIASTFNLIINVPSLLQMLGLTPYREAVRMLYNAVGYLGGILLVMLGLVHWSKSVIRLNDEMSQRIELQEQLESKNIQLGNQARELELLTVDYIDQREIAIQAEQTKTEFLRNTSHELRTPLNAVIGFSELIRDDIPATREQRSEYAKMILSSSHRLLEIINSILEMARIDTKQYVPDLLPSNICLITDQIIKLLTPTAQRKSISLSIRCPEKEEILAVFDQNATRQALMHVLDNAIKFSKENDTVEISISDTDAHYIVVSVRDNGPGISPKHLSSIFDVFAKAESSLTRANESSGLGLTFFKKLAEIQGGKVQIESDGKSGTTCKLFLPKLQPSSSDCTRPSKST